MLLSNIYPPRVYFKGGDAALQHIPPGGIFSRGGGYGSHAGLGVVTEQPPHCREGMVGGGGGKHRSATGPGGGGGESAAAGLAQCLGDDQIDTGPTVVPTAGAPLVEAFEDVSELARWDALAVIGDVDECGGRLLSVDADPDLPAGRGVSSTS